MDVAPPPPPPPPPPERSRLDSAAEAASGVARWMAATAERARPHLLRGAGHAGRGVTHVARELNERRGLRAALIGIALVLTALLLGMGSALTPALLVVGAVLIAAGALGPRLSGRFAIEWGASGTVIDLRAEITPPGTVASERSRTLPLPVSVEQPNEIESTGETIEIDLAELEALIDRAGITASSAVQEGSRPA